MPQLTDDCFADGGRLMTIDAALERIARVARPVTGTERVPLRAASGRILAEDVVSERDVPPDDNAAVDGYAVYFDDLDPGRETRLPVTGRIAAGHPLGRAARRGEALRVFTGAPMPEGPDTVLEGFTITGAPREAAAAGRCPRTSWIVSIDSAAPKRTCWPLKIASAWLIRSVRLRRRAEVIGTHTAPGQGRRAPLEISIILMRRASSVKKTSQMAQEMAKTGV